MFDQVIAFYGRTLKRVLKHQPLTLVVALPRWFDHPALYRRAQGIFPGAGHRRHPGNIKAPQNVSFPAMAQKQQELADVILKDPAVESLSSFIGVDGINTTLNSGRILINLKPLEQRKINATDIIRRLQPN